MNYDEREKALKAIDENDGECWEYYIKTNMVMKNLDQQIDYLNNLNMNCNNNENIKNRDHKIDEIYEKMLTVYLKLQFK